MGAPIYHRRPPRRRRLAFAVAAIALAVVLPLITVVGADLYLHRRYDRTSTVNVWGYRGPIVGRKAPGSRRVVFLGGSSAFGFGVSWEQAIPAQLQSRLNARRPKGQPAVTVVNLGFNNEGAYAFRYALGDFAYLDYDVVCLYEGYNDLAGDRLGPNRAAVRHGSAVFRLTGYFPILPTILREKAAAIRYGGDVDAMYRRAQGGHAPTVFRAGTADRVMAGALDAAVAVGESLEGQLGRLTDLPARDGRVPAAGSGCASPWTNYCESLFEAVDLALARGARVVVITQPYLAGRAGDRQRDQQQSMRAALRRRFGSNDRVQYVDLGAAVDVADVALSFDRMHLTAAGNARIADRLTPYVLAAVDAS